MRKVSFLFCLTILLFSCRTQFPIAYNSDKAKNPDYNSYIKPKKGDLVAGEKIEKKNESKLFKATVFTLNGTSFKAKEIQEYQDQSGLYVNIGGELSKALTGPRINVFRKTSQSTTFDGGGHMRTQQDNNYYIKKVGQDDYKYVNLNSTKTLKDWVEDNNDAYEEASLAHKYATRVKLHRIFSWAGIIGGLAMISLDPSNGKNYSDDVSVMSYTGFGLFCGGIINLPINAFYRRAKAGRAYAKAINLYNEAPVKKKK